MQRYYKSASPHARFAMYSRMRHQRYNWQSEYNTGRRNSKAVKMAMTTVAMLVALSVNALPAHAGGESGRDVGRRRWFQVPHRILDLRRLAERHWQLAGVVPQRYPPYGSSYTFGDKPGLNRYSDGRLIVDFVGTPPSPHHLYPALSSLISDLSYLPQARRARCQLLIPCV